MAAIHSSMGGDAGQWDAEGALPEQHLAGQAAVLRIAVAGVCVAIIATILRRYQADVKSDVVDGAHLARLAALGDITEG